MDFPLFTLLTDTHKVEKVLVEYRLFFLDTNSVKKKYYFYYL